MATSDIEESFSVQNLSNQYLNELQDLRQRTQRLSDVLLTKAKSYQQQLKDISPSLNEERDKLLATLSDRSQISNLDAAQMMSTFTWAGVMLTGMTTGCIFTRYLLSPILSLFVSPFYVAAFAYIAMPLIAIQYSTGPIEGDFKEVDRSRRHDLLTISIVEGMLKGFLFSDRYMPGMAPFSFITPLCIGILAPFASPYIANERLRLVAFTVGTSLLVHLGFGVFNGFTLGFVALTILYGAIGYGMLQLYLKYGDGEDKTHSYQLAYLLAVVYSQAFVFSLFTVDANGLAASN